MSTIKLPAASGGGSISLKGPSSAGSDTDFLDTSGNLTVTGTSTLTGNLTVDGAKLTVDSDNAYGNIVISRDGGVSGRRPFGIAISGSNDADLRITASNDTNSANAFTTGLVDIQSGGNVSITDGNLVVASGHGIDFSATADGGGTSTTQETLSDYEEGTWTPVDASGGSVSFTDTAGNCKYTKIGRLVIASFTVTYLSTSNTAQARVGGLPYACVGTTNNNASVAIGETNDSQQTRMVVNQGQSYMLILHCHNAVVVLNNSEAAGHNYRGTAIYQTA